MQQGDLKKLFGLPVIVAALGYFVDIYDLLLFSIVRRPSLIALGVPDNLLLEQGEHLLRIQMTGLLVGGIIWGIMGDKRGRLSVLFGSILLYSLANIANGFVASVPQYAVLRFIAGVGLAGELGAGVTLVSESLPAHLRGYGTTIIATVGLMGAVVGNLVASPDLAVYSFESWQISYFVGGAMGLLLLIARVSVLESGIFLKTKQKDVARGNFFQLFTKRRRLVKFLGSIFIGLPIWYAIGILISFSPEFASVLAITEPITTGNAVMYGYIGLAVGDLVSGLSSQIIRSRKKIVGIFIALTMATVVLYLYPPVKTANFFYFTCFMVGVGIGYWALFVTIAAEQFGTNLRSTAATTVPNFIRGTVVPLTLTFEFLRGKVGIIQSALFIGIATVIIAFIALQVIDETYGCDLNFEEEG